MGVAVRNDQLFSVREASRYLSQQIDKLKRGDVDKIVIMNRTRMEAVLITVEEYERLTSRGRGREVRRAA